ncbi:MAG: heavy-metal-associated domain-containing protein [Thermoplasmata archaeon]
MNVHKVTLKIFGMTCEDCVYTVKSNLEKAGAKEVNVSLDDGIATLFIESETLSPHDLVKLPVFSKDSPYKAQIRKVE